MFKFVISITAGIFLVACTSPNAGTRQIRIGGVSGISTTGSTRVITERSRDGRIVCTEPSPDYAVAFNTTRSITVNSPAAATDKASGSATSNRTETIVEPSAGRSEAVMALRDGLYTACQSYANGVIGQDAYSIILSQYGYLLVALIADKGSTGAGRPAPAPAQAAFSALLVACISSHDPSRPSPGANPMLGSAFCSRVLHRALDRVSG